MTDTPAARRRFFAEDIQVVANLKSTSIVEALASVPREQFLPPGPWTIRSEVDLQSGPRQTPDADPRHVYHNVAVAIDPARTLFNGAPALLCTAIDALMLSPGQRVLHLGTGLGYYTAILAACVGPTGHVAGLEIDADLHARARENLAAMPWVEMRASGTLAAGEMFDAILINAGVTHPQPDWLDALTPGGRIVLPLTVAMPQMGPIGKGLLLAATGTDDPRVFSLRIVAFVAIYSAIGLRDDAVNGELGRALQKAPYPPLKRLRRDAHDADASCWLHTPGGCLSLS